MSYPNPIQWNYFEADLFWADGTFKGVRSPNKLNSVK